MLHNSGSLMVLMAAALRSSNVRTRTRILILSNVSAVMMDVARDPTAASCTLGMLCLVVSTEVEGIVEVVTGEQEEGIPIVADAEAVAVDIITEVEILTEVGTVVAVMGMDEEDMASM
ncbi:hypothetical protein CC80DRAFT_495445 [Byssothecium circinans]|uniref:Uncharacterized protein n=1 Tax=Byssothecium circinans TaxID=147558 RepID=A0A6A5TJ46_9PLEO|nr:hypothetical protein CC80DRAFT_495445 [Byssothecium circinans]